MRLLLQPPAAAEHCSTRARHQPALATGAGPSQIRNELRVRATPSQGRRAATRHMCVYTRTTACALTAMHTPHHTNNAATTTPQVDGPSMFPTFAGRGEWVLVEALPGVVDRVKVGACGVG
jgi:hypothetical protein